MKPAVSILQSFVLIISLAVSGLAQTATWIAPGTVGAPPYNPPTPSPNWLTGDWQDGANWSTGLAPNGSGAVAFVNQTTNAAMSLVPGGAWPQITGDVTLGELRYDLPANGTTRFTGLYLGSQDPAGPAGHLRLDGTGITIQAAGTSAISYVDLHVQPGSFLDFSGRASVSRTGFTIMRLFLTGTSAHPDYIRFFGDSSPGALIGQSGGIYTSGPTVWEFRDRSTAGSGVLPLSPNSTATFWDQTSAGTSTLQFLYNGPNNDAAVRFAGSSTAAQSVLTSPNTQIGAVEFIDQATGGSATINYLRRIDITGATTGTGTTGRLRATTSTLTPTTVVADDARTITLGNVNVQDVLLGSNTLQVTGGSIGLIRDTGGAYLSAAGENLSGGGLIKTGPGTLYLNSPTYNPVDPLHPAYFVMTGPTIIRQGEVRLYNRIASATVESAGVLTGNGTVSGHLLNQGRVIPDISNGLRVTGNYTQTTGGTYVYDSNNLYWYPGGPALLQIGGNATLAGRLETYINSSFFPNRKPGTLSQTILTAASISGRFDTVGSAYTTALLPITPIYSPTTVTLRFDLLPVAALAGTPAQLALGSYLDRFYQYSGPYNSPVNYQGIVEGLRTIVSQDAVSRSLNNFAPDRYGAVMENSLAAASSRRAVLDRILAADRESGSRTGSFYLEGGQHRYTAEAVDQLPSVDSRTNTWIAGGTWHHEFWSIGAYVATDKSQLTLDQAGSRADIESVEPGLFAQYEKDGFFAHVAAGFSRDSYELQRSVDYGFYTNTNFIDSAAPDGTRHDYSATVGWTWRHAKWSLTPLVGMEFTHWQVDDFTETTSSTYYRLEPMSFSNWSRDSRRTRVGAELSGQLWKGRVRPRLSATWWHEFETDRTIPARFVGEPTGYLAPGRPADINVVQVGLGLDWWITDRLVFSATASGARGDYTDQASEFTGGLRWEF